MASRSVKLSEIAQLNPTLDVKLSADTPVAFVPMSAVSAISAAVEQPTVRAYGEVSKGYTPFNDGDVLVAKTTPCFENGKIAQARLSLPKGFGSTEFHVVRPKDGEADARCLLHFLRQDRVRKDGTRRMTGSAGQRRVPESFLAGLEIQLPPLPEQRRIAAILDQVETLRSQRRAAIAQLDSLGQAVFLEMFGDPLTNPKGWLRKAIGKLGKVVTGNTPSRAVSTYFGSDVEWVKSDNINTPDYYLTRATESLSLAGKAVARTVPAASILVTCIAGSPSCIGNAAMTNREVAFNQQINAFVPLSTDPHFAYMNLILGKRLVQDASTNGMKGMVSKSRFEQIVLMQPPLSLQRAFAERIQSIERLKATNRAALAHLNELFASLQHRAFRGEL